MPYRRLAICSAVSSAPGENRLRGFCRRLMLGTDCWNRREPASVPGRKFKDKQPTQGQPLSQTEIVSDLLRTKTLQCAASPYHDPALPVFMVSPGASVLLSAR